MLPNISAIIREVQTFAQGNSAVLLAYLHGSAATGHMDSESDIDIALVVHNDLSQQERFDLRLRCIGFLMKKFPAESDAFDVIALQDVPLLLQFNVIRRGRLLFERNKGDRLEFELAVERMYDDEEPLLRREAETTIDRILSRPSA